MILNLSRQKASRAAALRTDGQDGQSHADVSGRREFGRERRLGGVVAAPVPRHRSPVRPPLVLVPPGSSEALMKPLCPPARQEL